MLSLPRTLTVAQASQNGTIQSRAPVNVAVYRRRSQQQQQQHDEKEGIHLAENPPYPTKKIPKKHRSTRIRSKNCRNLKVYGMEVLFRRRAGSRENQLERDMSLLREKILELDRQRLLMDSITITRRQNAANIALRVMEDYHNFFLRGYNPSKFANHTEIEHFLESVMLADLKCPDFTGREVFLSQWEHYSKFHSEIRVDSHGLELMQETEEDLLYDSESLFAIKSTGVTTTRISRDTIVHIFPHILQDETLVQWLLGKEYSFNFTLIMHFNLEGRIFQVESMIDLTSALLNLLNDPFVTIKMIESSLVTKAGNLKTQTEVQEFQNELEHGILY